MYRSDPIEGMHRFEIKATEKRHVAPVEEECRVDVHASRDAVGCPAHAQNKLEWAPHHTTLPFDLLSLLYPNYPSTLPIHPPPLVFPSWRVCILTRSLQCSSGPSLYYHDPSVTSFEPCKTCSTSRARPRIPLL
jgi:hypothetical protein